MKILLFPLDAVGHSNPMFALASKLLQKGHHVRFIVTSDRLEEHIRKLPFTNYDVREVLQYPKGTVFDNDFIYSKIPPYEEQHETDRKMWDLLLLSLKEQYKAFPNLLAAAEEYNPDLIISDPICLNPFIIAHKLNTPCVSLMTLPSFLTSSEVCTSSQELQRLLLSKTLLSWLPVWSH